MASFAQERLWMDEKVRFNQSGSNQISVYNELLVYQLSTKTTFPIYRLRHALQLIVAKHAILRTVLIYDQDKFTQKILPMSDDRYHFEATYVIDDNHLKQILYNEKTNRALFDLEQGLVFRCHVLRCSSNNENDNHLKQDDMILFNFHHIAIDGNSISIFIDDLRQAIIQEELLYNDNENISYLDYAQYERLEDWTNAREYWRHVLTNWNSSIPQQDSSFRTGKGYTITFDLDHDLVNNLNCFISQSNLTLFQFGLAAFFTFLFKMSNSEQLDLCIGIAVRNRSHYQFQDIIGFFANTLPFCLKINPYESFAQLYQRVQQTWFNILPHSHLPCQEIIKVNQNTASTLVRTVLQVETSNNNTEQNIELNEGTTFNIIQRNLLPDNVAKFDMTCALYENRQNETISMSLNASLDVYDQSDDRDNGKSFQEYAQSTTCYSLDLSSFSYHAVGTRINA